MRSMEKVVRLFGGASKSEPSERPPCAENAKEQIRICDTRLANSARANLSKMQRSFAALDTDWRRELESLHQNVRLLGSAREALDTVVNNTESGIANDGSMPQVAQFVVTAASLRQWSRQLAFKNGGVEQAGFVTGFVTETQKRMLSNLQRIHYDIQSATAVVADVSKTHRQLFDIREVYDETLIATLHSHPSAGTNGTVPSNTDERTQERYERMGHRTVSGIFSTDGYVRFFSCGFEFHFEVQGKGAKGVVKEPKSVVYRLFDPREDAGQ